MADSSRGSSGGIGVFGVLGIVFVTLKLCHVIDWSWWYVTLPFWGPLAFLLAFVLLAFAFAGVFIGVAKIGEKLGVKG